MLEGIGIAFLMQIRMGELSLTVGLLLIGDMYKYPIGDRLQVVSTRLNRPPLG